MPSEALISPIGEEVLQKALLCKYNNILFMRKIVETYGRASLPLSYTFALLF